MRLAALRVLASHTRDGQVERLPGTEQIVPFDGQTAAVAGVSFSPDGSTVVSASNDGTARLWRSSGPQLASIYRPKTSTCSRCSCTTVE